MNPAQQDSPLQKARREAYRQVILDAAERVFANHGFDAAKIQAIAEEAGVSVGTVYSVFGSKSELFSFVLTRRLPELIEVTTGAAINAESTFDKLAEGLNAYIEYMLNHPEYLQIHLAEHAWGLGPTRASAEQLTAWRDGLELEASILKQAIEEGVVIDEDPHRLARCITAVQQVQLWDWVENGMQEPPQEVAGRISRLLVQMICVDRDSNR